MSEWFEKRVCRGAWRLDRGGRLSEAVAFEFVGVWIAFLRARPEKISS